MPWRRALVVWMLIMFLETLHGLARELFIAPVLGDLRARQLGVAMGCMLIFLVALLTTRWLGAATRRAQFVVGALWVGLTLLFEVALAAATGTAWSRLLSDYNPARGGFMVFGLLFLAAAPAIAAALRPGARRQAS